jgi:hypothetical protein
MASGRLALPNQLMSCVNSASTPNDHGSACTASGSKEIAVSQLFLLPQKTPVNLLSISGRFLLCIHALAAVIALRASSVRFAVPQCLVALQRFERIVEARLGLSG